MAGLMCTLSNLLELFLMGGIEEGVHVGSSLVGEWFPVPFENRFVQEVRVIDDLDTIGDVDSVSDFFWSAI